MFNFIKMSLNSAEKQSTFEKQFQHQIKEIFSDILKNRPTEIYEHIAQFCETKIEEKSKKSRIIKLSQFEEESEDEPDPNKKTPIKRIENSDTNSDSNCNSDIISDCEFEKKLDNLIKRNTRQGISAEDSKTYEGKDKPVIDHIPKTQNEREFLLDVLRESVLFSYIDFPDKHLLIDSMQIKNFPKETIVINQGDEGNELFIVALGTLNCFKKDPDTGKEIFLIKLKKGNVFGELALLYNTPRSASVRAETNSIVYTISRAVFNVIVKNSLIKRHEIFNKLIEKVDFLSQLSTYQKQKISDCLVIENFEEGDVVIKQDDEAKKMYFVLDGVLDAVRVDKSGDTKKVFEFKYNDYFGELALLNDSKRQATIIVTSTTARLASLDRNSFHRLCGDVKEILKLNSKKYQQYVNSRSSKLKNESSS